ncbi:putative alpha-mannosidase [Shigella flexneri 2002017]|nr:putative alpha-mannosidase [Shigella flexneri 2002017]
MSGSAFAVTHHAFSSGAGRTSDGNGSHASTLKSPSYTKSVSWQHYRILRPLIGQLITQGVNRQNQAGEIITLYERPAVLVVAGRG